MPFSPARRISILATVLSLSLSAVACKGIPAPVRQVIAKAEATLTTYADSTPMPDSTPDAQTNPSNAPRAGAALPAVLTGLGLEGGVVTSNDGSSTIGMRLAQSSEQLAVSSSTLVILPGKKNAQLSDIQVGDRIIAETADTSGAPAAFLLDFPKGYTKDNIITGTLSGRTKGGVEIKVRGGSTRQVTGDASTLIVQLVDRKVTVVKAADLKKGDLMVVIGQGTTNSFTAQTVLVLDRAAIQAGRKPAVTSP